MDALDVRFAHGRFDQHAVDLGNRDDPLRFGDAIADADLASRRRRQKVLVNDDAALARVWLYEPATNTLRLRASAGLSTEVERSSRAVIDLRRER